TAWTARADVGTGRRPRAVTTWAIPVTASPAVITHGSTASVAASALIVSSTGSKSGCRDSASSHPPIIATGAVADDASAQRGTRAPLGAGDVGLVTFGGSTMDDLSRARRPRAAPA